MTNDPTLADLVPADDHETILAIVIAMRETVAELTQRVNSIEVKLNARDAEMPPDPFGDPGPC